MQFSQTPLNFLNSPAKLRIVKFLLTHEALMSEREIASVLKLSHMSVNRTMQELAGANFVHCTTAGKAHLWRVNRKSFLFNSFQRLTSSLEEMPDPLERLKAMVLKYLPKEKVRRVVLFGSVAKNLERPDSDIDVFILVADSGAQKALEGTIEKLSTECLEIFGNRLSPYILTEPQLKQKSRLKIIGEINKGIQIYPEEKAV